MSKLPAQSSDKPASDNVVYLQNRDLPPATDQADIAEYIAQISGELAKLARSANLDALSYMLDMAHLHATEIIKSSQK